MGQPPPPIAGRPACPPMPTALRLGAFAVVVMKLLPLLFVVGYLVWGLGNGGECSEDDICDGLGLVFALLVLALLALAVFVILAGAHLLLAIRGSVLGVGVSGAVLLVVDVPVAFYGLLLTLANEGGGPQSYGAAVFIVVVLVWQLTVTIGALLLHYGSHR